ncbi:MAG: class C beta-lactamase-related serine hydrolase [Balneolaceae bacterium]|nr:MAG: class C beta-lactamase-related serine hydrolase [Balneolaceae bacterium]
MKNFLFSVLITVFSSFTGESGLHHTDKLDEIFDIGTVQSLIIQKNGTVIAEKYRGRINGNLPVNIKSASKSVLSLLVGIAIEEGYLEGVHQTLGDFFPEYFEDKPDPVKESVTIKDLLTMRSGLETTSFMNYGRWVMSNNWVYFTLNQPLAGTPGEAMIYSTGTSHLLSAIITRASGMSTLEFGNRYLFRPMGIRIGGWDQDPQGYYMGGNNMAMSPLDLVKIGELMMNVGKYNGRQLVSREWILESVEIYTKSNFNPYHYGYMWWRKQSAGYEVFFAWGNGGQYIMILPELDTVISITSSLSTSNSRRYQREIFQFLGDVIIPAIKNHPG